MWGTTLCYILRCMWFSMWPDINNLDQLCICTVTDQRTWVRIADDKECIPQRLPHHRSVNNDHISTTLRDNWSRLNALNCKQSSSDVSTVRYCCKAKKVTFTNLVRNICRRSHKNSFTEKIERLFGSHLLLLKFLSIICWLRTYKDHFIIEQFRIKVLTFTTQTTTMTGKKYYIS